MMEMTYNKYAKFMFSKTACLRRERTMILTYLDIKSEDDVLALELTLNKLLAGSLPVREISLLVFTPELV